MDREEEILEFAHDYSEQNYKGDNYEAYAEKEDIAKACVDSIKWADKHPRKGLVDIDKVASFIKYHAQEFVYVSAHSGEAKINEFKLVEAMYKAIED